MENNTLKFQSSKHLDRFQQKESAPLQISISQMFLLAARQNPLVAMILDGNPEGIRRYAVSEFTEKQIFGKLPLFWCLLQVNCGRLDSRCFTDLVRKTQGINQADFDGNTMMHCIANMLTHVQRRLEQKNLNFQEMKKQTLLLGFMRALIEKGGDMFHENKMGKTPVMIAFEGHCVPLILLFREKGAFKKVIYHAQTGISNILFNTRLRQRETK